MADTGKGYFGGPAYVWARATEVATNIGANQSTVRVQAWCGVASPSYAEFSASTVTVGVDGQSKVLGTQSYYYYPPYGDDYLGGWDFVVDHNADGSRSIGFSVSFPTGIGTGSASSTITLEDFIRTAGAPSNVAAVYTPGTGTHVTWNASTSYITPVTYYVSYQSSSNGGSTWGSWSSETSTTNIYADFNSLTLGLTYKFRVRAANGQDGYSGYTESVPVFMAAGGKRFIAPNPGGLVQMQTKRRWTGTAWVDISTRKRWTGTEWVNLS